MRLEYEEEGYSLLISIHHCTLSTHMLSHIICVVKVYRVVPHSSNASICLFFNIKLPPPPPKKNVSIVYTVN